MCQRRPLLPKWQKNSCVGAEKMLILQSERQKGVCYAINLSCHEMKLDLHIHKLILSYLIIGVVLMTSLTLLPVPGGYTWTPWVVNLATTVLFLLLIFLTSRLARTDKTCWGVLLTGAFILLFCPGVEKFFLRDEQGLLELGSQCIVPFFIGQYTRIRRKDFHRWYFLMLLMGIFCSYTHNGVSIPLFATFMWLSFRHLKGFFRMACWPMVIGFAIGTTLSIIITDDADNQLTLHNSLPEAIRHLSSNTLRILRTLWDTKVFVISIVMTGYLLYGPKGRMMLQRIARRHFALIVCLIFSLISMPLAPLGIDNAVHGVCFFCMFWLLFLVKYLAERYLAKKI